MADEFYSLDEKDTWQTPSDITDTLQEHVDIALDPCAGLFTFIGEENWTIEVPDTVPQEYTVQPFAEDPYEVVVTHEGRTLRCGGDSLSRAWDTGGIAFVNPPFSMKESFIEKTLTELDAGNIDAAIVLTPDSTDVKSWWHGQLAPAGEYVWFSEGRISFIDPDTGELQTNPTFGTALHFLGDAAMFPESLFAELGERGDMMKRV